MQGGVDQESGALGADPVILTPRPRQDCRGTDRDVGGEVYHDVMPGHRAAERFRVEETRCDGERASSAQQFAASPRAQPAPDRKVVR